MMICNLKKFDTPLPDASIFGHLLLASIRCFGTYHHNTRCKLKEVKDIVNSFIFTFNQINLVLFTEVIESNIKAIVHEFQMSNEIMAFFQYFTANQFLAKKFIGISLRYLMKHLDELGKDKNSTVLVRLFKICFVGVTLIQDNEVVLNPHLSNSILELEPLRLATHTCEPAHYYTVLRVLFPGIGGGRFEMLYKEVSPLLQVLLESGSLFAYRASRSRSKYDLCSNN